LARNRWLLGCALLIAGTVATVALAFLVVNMALEGDRPSFSALQGRVGLVELVGDIDDSEPIVEELQRHERDSTVRAVVIRVDSPGGGVAASQEIYEAVQKLHDDGKPVVVSMGGVAASGAYYVSCAADSIVCNPGTLTGSIGVIMSFPNTEALFRKVGVNLEVVKTGKFKDIGSMWRPMTEDERKLLQGVLSDVYDQFVDAIVDGRSMNREDVVPYADGRVFTGSQALEYGFVDRLGDLDDAIQMAAKMGGISGRPGVVRKERRGVGLFDFLDQKLNLVKLATGLSSSGPRLEYRLR
jgi:protease IV